MLSIEGSKESTVPETVLKVTEEAEEPEA